MDGQVVIELLREAPFLKGGTVFRGADMDDPNAANMRLSQEPFVGKVIGARTERLCFNKVYNKWMWDEDFLGMEEFKKIVERCAVVGNNRRIIKFEDINFYDIDDDFFTDEKFSKTLVAGKCVLDLGNPVEKLMAACFLVDSRFVRITGEGPINYSDEQIYSIGFADAVEKARIADSEVQMDVAAILQNTEREKLLILCKVWNMFPSNKVSDKKIRAMLFDHISRDADAKRMKSRGNFFLRFASMSKEKIQTFNSFMDGIKARLITRSFNDELYIFNSRELGRDEEESVEFLELATNQQLLKDLREGIKLKSSRKVKEELLAIGEEDGNKSANP